MTTRKRNIGKSRLWKVLEIDEVGSQKPERVSNQAWLQLSSSCQQLDNDPAVARPAQRGLPLYFNPVVSAHTPWKRVGSITTMLL